VKELVKTRVVIRTIAPSKKLTVKEEKSLKATRGILEEIRENRPKGSTNLELQLSEQELHDRIHGGWLGRCAGCLLGKPVELWTSKMIEDYLSSGKAYPLDNYFPLLRDSVPKPLLFSPDQAKWTLNSFNGMPRDDDTDYTIMALHIFEENGYDFMPKDVGEQWLSHLPYNSVFTAEKIAYKNLVDGLLPPETATTNNPFSEWIGAQIRADLWGYVSPGMPELAAEFAFRDAVLSHIREGIYGAMFFSSLIAAAFSTSQIEELLNIGLAEIPKNSEFSSMVKQIIAWSNEEEKWKDAWRRIDAKYGKLPPFHTINNAAFVLLGLLYGKGDFEKSITIAVMAGLDTDCNGATTGSIMGVILGAKQLPTKWVKPIDDKIKSAVLGFHESKISELAKKTQAFARSNLERCRTTGR
jgi:ADP-ribosylglycohydrolase